MTGFDDKTLGDMLAGIDSSGPSGSPATRIIAIDGFGGAGKSTLAAAVSRRRKCDVIHTDDFARWDEPLEWWLTLLAQVLQPLDSGQTARYQRYDWDLRQLAEWHEVAPGGLVIVEGVSSSRAAFRPYLSFSVWVDTPRSVRLARGLQRDGSDAREQWLKWMADEDEWAKTETPMEHADFRVPGAGND